MSPPNTATEEAKCEDLEEAKCEDLKEVVIDGDPEKFFRVGAQLPL